MQSLPLSISRTFSSCQAEALSSLSRNSPPALLSPLCPVPAPGSGWGRRIPILCGVSFHRCTVFQACSRQHVSESHSFFDRIMPCHLHRGRLVCLLVCHRALVAAQLNGSGPSTAHSKKWTGRLFSRERDTTRRLTRRCRSPEGAADGCHEEVAPHTQ